MLQNQKIVWAEGVFLGQQHFQQWDSQLHAALNTKGQAHSSFPWGLFSLDIDEARLEKGRFKVQQCTAILPDGQLINYEGSQDRPLQDDLGGHGGDTLEVFIAQPANKDVGGISGYPSHNKNSAWLASYTDLNDLHDPQRQREVLLASPNLLVLTNEDPLENFITIKVAEVFNEGDGSYRLLKDYIPPVLRIGASYQLIMQIERLVEVTSAKTRTLNDRLRYGTGGPAEFARQDPANFALLQLLNSALPQFIHFQQNQNLHPEPLYRLLSQTMGALCTFSPEAETSDIPPYRHDDLKPFFRTFEQILGSVINVSMPSQASKLMLTAETEALLSVTEIEDDTLEKSTFFLGVLLEEDNPNWITDFAKQVKVSSRPSIEMVVASALAGLNLVHTQRPPAKLATKSGYEYFRLEPRGDFWRAIIEEKSIAIFLPQHFTSANVELVTVQE